MAITYNYNVGFQQATGHSLTKKVWDKQLHEEVQNKSFFKGMMGKDKGGESSLDGQVSNFPIVEKTQLGKESGDKITMGLVRQLVSGDPYATASGTGVNSGKVGNQQLVDAEKSLEFYNTNVEIAHYRQGVLIEGKMTEQRSPYDLRVTAKDLLSSHLAKQQDDGLFLSIYSGFSANVHRELAKAGVVHPNQIYGKTTSATAISALSTSVDDFDTAYLELISASAEEMNINPIVVDGEPCYLAIIHPAQRKQLRSDSLWLDANARGMERGSKNPIFSGADGFWGGVAVKVSNKIATAKDFTATGMTVSSNVITLATATLPASTTVGDFRGGLLLGANAIARAYGLESYMAQRKEDDYGNMVGFAGGVIYGDKRADYARESGSSASPAIANQSSLIFWSYSPSTLASGITGEWA